MPDMTQTVPWLLQTSRSSSCCAAVSNALGSKLLASRPQTEVSEQLCS